MWTVLATIAIHRCPALMLTPHFFFLFTLIALFSFIYKVTVMGNLENLSGIFLNVCLTNVAIPCTYFISFLEYPTVLF